MNCGEANDRLPAWLDGEITGEAAAALEAHLESCAGCRQEMMAAVKQDRALRSALATGKRAERVIAATLAKLEAARPAGVAAPARRASWLPLGWAVAAGIGVAVGYLIHQPGQIVVVRDGGSEAGPKVAVAPLPSPTAATLALATGRVELQSEANGPWTPLATGASIPESVSVRTTPSTVCEFRLPDGSEVRLNSDTELRLAGGREFALAKGQVFSKVKPAATAFAVESAGTKVTALGTEFDVRRSGATTAVLVVAGRTKVTTGTGEETLTAGNTLEIKDGSIARRAAVADLVSATRWVHGLLVLKGTEDAELAKRVETLFATIGREKMSYLKEPEIRMLGVHSVRPLLGYLRSTKDGDDGLGRRALAGRILADLAAPVNIPDLIGLLGDANDEVRADAARGLERLSRRGGTARAEFWREAPEKDRAAAIAEWKRWWSENSHLEPSAGKTGAGLELR